MVYSIDSMGLLVPHSLAFLTTLGAGVVIGRLMAPVPACVFQPVPTTPVLVTPVGTERREVNQVAVLIFVLVVVGHTQVSVQMSG